MHRSGIPVQLLIVDTLDDAVVRWLQSRHSVHYQPDLDQRGRGFRLALSEAVGAVLPPAVAVNASLLAAAPRLQVIGRVSAGAENIDAGACAEAGIEVVRSHKATARAEAEFMIGALLSLLRRVPVADADGMLVGRELGGATVGLVGMGPAARATAQLLGAFGARVVGYEPSLHATDPLWLQWRVQPLGVQPLFERSDAVCVTLPYFSRFHGLIGERLLQSCKPDQVIVGIGHSAVFDQDALAQALGSGRIAAAWLDSLEPGALDIGRPLAGIDALQVTPRVASTTRESRLRSAWTVAKRIDQLLRPGDAQGAGEPVAPPSADVTAPQKAAATDLEVAPSLP